MDDGSSGSILVRPGLERLRDPAAAGAIDRLYRLDPDRLSRPEASQVLIREARARGGVAVVVLRHPRGRGPAEALRLQVPGLIAADERATILACCRRGPQHAARRGAVHVPSGAPAGSRYVGQHPGDGAARYQVVAEEARVVRKRVAWVGPERGALGAVCRRLPRDGGPTRTGKSAWDRSTVGLILKNLAARGTAAVGKMRWGGLKPQRRRPQRGRPEQPRRPVSRVDTSPEYPIVLEVPGLVSEDRFGAVHAQLEEKRPRRRDRRGGGRYWLPGWVVGKQGGDGCSGKPTRRASSQGKDKIPDASYRCTGAAACRVGGPRLCWNKQLRTALRDAAVWEECAASGPSRRGSGGRTRGDFEMPRRGRVRRWSTSGNR